MIEQIFSRVKELSKILKKRDKAKEFDPSKNKGHTQSANLWFRVNEFQQRRT